MSRGRKYDELEGWRAGLRKRPECFSRGADATPLAERITRAAYATPLAGRCGLAKRRFAGSRCHFAGGRVACFGGGSGSPGGGGSKAGFAALMAMMRALTIAADSAGGIT